MAVDRDGKTYLAGRQLSRVQFVTELKNIGALENPEPVVFLETEMGAPCQAVEQVRSLMDEHLDCTNDGHCDEGIRSVWSELPYTGQGVR